MILNSRLQTNQSDDKSPALLLIHGLFGSLDNLGVLARELKEQHTTIQVDVRNHGHSPHSDAMDYHVMAQDIMETLEHHHIDKVRVIGHSMGGKIAMALTAIAPNRIESIVMIDIAPVDYQVRRHDDIFAAIRAVNEAQVTTRTEATHIMKQHIDQEMVIQFLLKSFQQGKWLFNVEALWNHYSAICGWETVPTWSGPALFIRGGDSPYLDDQYRDTLLAQFPHASAYVIPGTGHWVHAEKPAAVLRAIQRFYSATKENH